VEAPPLERKLVAILAADVAGYSRMMHVNEETTLATLSAHRTIIDDLIAAGGGGISGTAGDSVLAEFASVVDAMHCAVAIQQALHKAMPISRLNVRSNHESLAVGATDRRVGLRPTRRVSLARTLHATEQHRASVLRQQRPSPTG
jgi:class 3 adenylate cyclase